MKNAYKILVGKPEVKKPLRQLGRRWEDNIGIHLEEVGWEVMDWIHLVQDRDQWQSVVTAAVVF
jgi:hypothetical protein